EGGGQVEREWFVHLEVLSADARMPTFLSNPADVKGEKRTVMAPKGKMLYARQSASGQETFTATAATLGAQCVLPRETTTPAMDESQQWWFNISGSGWLPQKDIEEVGQYDLLKLGFQPLEENSSGDMTYSPYEGWVPEAFGSISRAAEQGDEWLYEQVPPYYRQLMAEMDKDGDGKVTEEEIRQALVVRDPLVRNVVNHLTVRHHSEWYGGRSTGLWEEFYKDLDTDEVAYCEKWQTDLEWMSEVSPFNLNESVWHFHPVVFLDTIRKVHVGWARSPFANLLGSAESKNDYTAYNVTKTGKSVPQYNTNLTTMTISEVMQAQKNREMFAAGRFQLIPDTLAGAVKKLKLDTSLPYNENVQDKIFEEYIIKTKRPSFIRYLEGNGDIEDTIYDWAKEFASAGVRKGKAISPKKIKVKDEQGHVVYENGKEKCHLVPRIAQTEGESYYSGDGLNNAHISPDEMIQSLEESKYGQ
ncbi:EF-hand domain-containing protein, partial [Pseudocitrobacter faecalis]|uniref:EF-hand domain-containing protein n=1 Tax=Pseudocitrobacter faecalis TaxID=1398493 RepID=UPI0033162343